MRQRRVYAEYWSTSRPEEQAREQAAICNAARKIAAARIEPSKRNKEAVGGNVPVTAENSASALPEISDHNDVGLVIAGASLDPCFPFPHLVGSSQVCVPISTADFQ